MNTKIKNHDLPNVQVESPYYPGDTLQEDLSKRIHKKALPNATNQIVDEIERLIGVRH